MFNVGAKRRRFEVAGLGAASIFAQPNGPGLQGAKALALVHQKPILQVRICCTFAARFRQVRHKKQACRRNEPETWRAVGRKRCAMLRERAQKRAREQEESCCICKEIFGTSAAEKEKSTLFEGADRHQ